jgi:hypothetical protein
MDSINKNQAEDHIDHLEGIEATKKLKDLLRKSKNLLFSAPVYLFQVHSVRVQWRYNISMTTEPGWFLSAADSIKKQGDHG